ncbi:MAG: serine hydrolase, partial [Chloroflexota bacterium]|nr:serine hydrolase [Chloroflexota bacterium]
KPFRLRPGVRARHASPRQSSRSTFVASLTLLIVGMSLAGAAPVGAGDPQTGHVLREMPAAAATAAAWAEFDLAYDYAAPQTNFLAAEVVDGGCETVHALHADRRLALASTFKLYVLAELANQIASGDAAWEEMLPIQNELKSMPSGGTLYAPAGTRFTLRYFAERMIADSDNTATDHLIDRLGRERIEAALPGLGHGAPELNTPLLMTREFFAFKIAVSPERTDAYLDASDSEQRRILAEEIDPIQLDPSGWGSWVAPKRIDAVEWFASAEEVCQVVATLATLAQQPALAPLTGILALNRGGIFPASTWPYAGFKGGYEAGVYNMTWLLGRADGRLFVVTAGLNDPVNYVNLTTAGALMVTASTLLATAP